MVRKDFADPDPYSTHSSINEEVSPSRLFIWVWGIVFLDAGVWVHLHPSRSSCWVLGDRFSRCRCVGALAPLPLVLLGSGGLFFLMLVCGALVPLPPLYRSPPDMASPRRRQMSNGIHPHLCVPTALI